MLDFLTIEELELVQKMILFHSVDLKSYEFKRMMNIYEKISDFIIDKKFTERGE